MKNNSYKYIFLTLIFISLTFGLLIYANKEIKLIKQEIITSQVGQNVQTKKIGDVIVAALPIKDGTKVDFEIQLDTHTTDLIYKLEELALLKNESGETLKPIGWVGGHHRKGKLLFPVFNTAPKSIFLNIDNIEDSSIEFDWNL